MAKNSLPNARKAKQEEDLSGQLNTEIEEIDTSERNKKLSRSKCKVYVFKKHLEENIAVFVCFVCVAYMCAKCLLDQRSHDGDHRSHDGMRVRRMENETERTNTKRKVFVKETQKM